MCGAKHLRYKKVFCERLAPCGYGTPHKARGPRGFWIEWYDDKTRVIGFWEMIQRLTDRAKIRQRREDEERLRRRAKRVI